MNCTICNATIPEDAGFCPECQTTKPGQIGSQTVPFWKRSKLFLGLICVLGLWMISGIAGIFSPKTVEIELVDISPNNEVDEERFLLFLLEHELDSILFFSHEAPERAAAAIEETKEYAQSIVAHLQHHPVENKGIMESFQRVVGLADAYKSMLGDLGVMEVAAKGESGKMVLETGAKSAVLGYGAAQMLDTGDGSTLVFGALTGVVGAWYEGQTIEANRKAQIERVTAGFYTQVDQARADAVAVADDVAAKHSWNRASVGFVRDRKPYGQEQVDRHSKDLPPVLVDLVRQRPLNPIFQFHSIRLEDYLDGDSTSQQKQLEWSAKFIDLARLVPSGAVYDFFRWRYMMRAGVMALAAAEQEGQGKRLGESPKAAVTAAQCWKTALSINSSDPSGELRWGYGHSLALAGNLDEAREILMEIKEHVASNPAYHYLLVRLFSVKGEQEEALEHLKTALAKGFDKISEAKKSQDLENLRKAHGDEVDALLAVNFGWSVTYGTFNDDITITNQSAFPLTHLVLSPVISNSNGSFSPKQPLTLEKLDAGKSHTWVNCVSVKGGGDKDTRKAGLQCDQGSR